MSSNEVLLDYAVILIRDCLTYLWMMDNEYGYDPICLIQLIKFLCFQTEELFDKW